MSRSFRLYNCLLCHCQVMVCQQCDHGQRYCADSCGQISRQKSLKRANQKYQNSRKGSLRNAVRQKNFRQRQKNIQKIVTDQASPDDVKHYLLEGKPILKKDPIESGNLRSSSRCHFCQIEGSGFFRLDFLKKRTIYRNSEREK